MQPVQQVQPSGQIITLVHFSQSDGVKEQIACMPNATEFHATMQHPHYQRSNDPRAVSCPACKKTGAFQGAMGQIEGLIRSGVRAK